MRGFGCSIARTSKPFTIVRYASSMDGAGAAKLAADLAAFNLDEPASDAERRFGFVLGQAFHQGCSLADVSFAARLPSERVIAIGKRTIRRTKRLERL